MHMVSAVLCLNANSQQIMILIFRKFSWHIVSLGKVGISIQFHCKLSAMGTSLAVNNFANWSISSKNIDRV